MRFIKALLTSAGVLFFTVGTAVAAPLAMLQDQPIKVEIETEPTRTVWYTDPLWLGIGGIAILLIIVLAVMAGRGRGGDTTVVR